ncbi:MAG: hypothetical protein PHG89_10530 [Gallionella sp.]|nr:hypothetical protein [Gallionella sp.]
MNTSPNRPGIIGQLVEDVADLFGLGVGQEQFTEIEEVMSLDRVLGDKTTTLTRGGELARIIELRGKDYSGIDTGTLNGLYKGRKMFFEQLPSNVTAFAQSHRFMASRDMTDASFSNPFSAEVAKRWSRIFSSSFKTRHYLILATDNRTLTDKIGAFANGGNEEQYRLLNELCDNTLMRFKEYSPHILAGDEVSSYWAWLLNGTRKFVRLPASGHLDGALASIDIKFPARARHIVYQGDKARLSAMLYIFSPSTANATDTRMFDGLYRLHREFTIWQVYNRIGKQDALAQVKDKRKNVISFLADGDVIMMELDELATRIQSDDLAVMQHRWSVEVFADDLQDLDAGVQDIRGVVENQGFVVKRESAHRRGQFFSRFPEYTGQAPKGAKAPPNRRIRFPTSENAAHFTPFASAGEGLDSCTWGDEPVMDFKTPLGSDFSFTFQSKPDKYAPGHTIFIGGTGEGKTTTISVLLSQLYKYPNFRVLAFDRLRGLEVFTSVMGGEYLDIAHGLDVNPLQLPDNRESHAFLDNWFQVLTGKSEDEDLAQISQAIRQIYKLDRPLRTLNNSLDAFGLPVKGSVRAALERWTTGALSGIFTGEKDAMDFDKGLVTIDMTSMLELPDVLAPMAYYLFHKLVVQARNKGGYAVFVDELVKYLNNPTFAPKIVVMLEEIRKTDGVFIGAVQSADQILSHPAAPRFLANVETWVMFPDKTANRAHFTDDLRLNDQEYNWLTQSHKGREVLVKRKGGESTVINVDLAPLGELLRAFDSSDAAQAKLHTLRKERPNDWKDAFLRG